MKKLYMLVAVMFLSACGGHSASDWVGVWGMIPEDGGAPDKRHGFEIATFDEGAMKGQYFVRSDWAVRTETPEVCKLDNPEQSSATIDCLMPSRKMPSGILLAIDGDVITMVHEEQPYTLGRINDK